MKRRACAYCGTFFDAPDRQVYCSLYHQDRARPQRPRTRRKGRVRLVQLGVGAVHDGAGQPVLMPRLTTGEGLR